MLTYNAITEEHGQVVGLAYEKLVECFIEDKPHMPYINEIVESTPSEVAEYLIWRADKHAKQEIAEAAKHDILGPVKEVKQAVCPRCESKLMWDWDQDCFMVSRNNGPAVYCPITPVADKLHSHTCPHCMKVFAFSLIDDDGETTFSHPTHTNIDWQAEGNWFSMNTLELPIK